MKTLRQLFMVTVLSLTLSVSALAGHMDTTGVTAPPPPPNSTTQTSSTVTSILITVLDVIFS